MRAVWNPLLRGKFDRYWDQVSMAWLWARIHTRANSRSGAREKLAYVRGGFASVVRRLEAELAGAGVRVRTRTRVERIESEPERKAVLADGEVLAFDRCLFTGPSDAFARLLPDTPGLAAYRRGLESITYLGAICVILVTDQALGHHHWVNIHDTAAPFLVLVNHTALVGTELYQGRHVYYLGCYRPHDSPWFDRDDASLLAEWLGYLRRIFPGFDAARLQESHVFRFRNAQHVVDCDYQRRIPDFRTPLQGVYLANFSQIFPHDRGTNFAVRDGVRVAGMLLEDGRRARDPAK
jgi:protoporphyrinogen oxidase